VSNHLYRYLTLRQGKIDDGDPRERLLAYAKEAEGPPANRSFFFGDILLTRAHREPVLLRGVQGDTAKADF
jgi:hypothetical protein